MSGLPDNVPTNVKELLQRLADNSRGELDLVQSLADAIRRADENVLREVRTVTLQHELRREEILSELHTLATRLCCLPGRAQAPYANGGLAGATRAALRNHSGGPVHGSTLNANTLNGGGQASGHRNGQHYSGTQSHPDVATLQANGQSGGDWREAAQKIDDELDFTFETLTSSH